MSEARPRLDGLNLVVRDMDATIAFYRKLGLDIPDSAIWRTETGIHHVGVHMDGGLDLDFDSAELAAAYNEGFEPGRTASPHVIGFRFGTREEIDQRYAELTAAGHKGVQTPYDAFFGARYAIVEDPDGNHVGMMSPIDPEKRRAPPAL